MRFNGVNATQERRNKRGIYHRSFSPKRAVEALYSRLGTWPAVAKDIGGYSPAYWCLVAKGVVKPSREAENLLRRHLGLAPRRVRKLWDMRVDDLAWYLRHRRAV